MADTGPSPVWPERPNVITPDFGAASITEQKQAIARAGAARYAAEAQDTPARRAGSRSRARRRGR